ncbi:MAG: biopolymer transporter ExbB [Proteobacteria bacterium]|nr:biopolymer transporter ExbB [Pseudomonadota bacterium]MBS0573763.1 biopolymer transporter ExbB [Pseudomonadota bacterium]
MDKPVRASAPFFSQPVRQIAMMLIVSVLVSVGTYLVFWKIWPVVLDNPWLNGLIFAVFAIGIVTCFWQVAQLVTSVHWIEGFAASRPGHEATEPPRLLVPLAALLRSRGSRGGHISSSAARSILDSVSTRVEEARDITRYLTNLLIFLGLLGTLYGLSTTVPAVVDTIRALAPKQGESSAEVFSKLMTGLESQLGGMGTAFSSSLLGLAGSLVVGLLELFASHGQNRFYGELEEWLSSFTRLAVAGSEGDGDGPRAVIAALADHLEDQADFFRDIRDRAMTDHERTEAGLAALAEAIRALSERLDAGMGATADTFARMAKGQDRLADVLTAAVTGSEGGAVTADAESRMRLRSIDTQMLRLLEEVAAGRQEALGDLRADLAQLTRAVRGLQGLADSAARPGRG